VNPGCVNRCNTARKSDPTGLVSRTQHGKQGQKIMVQETHDLDCCTHLPGDEIEEQKPVEPDLRRCAGRGNEINNRTQRRVQAAQTKT
jgi:hypothetical protein